MVDNNEEKIDIEEKDVSNDENNGNVEVNEQSKEEPADAKKGDEKDVQDTKDELTIAKEKVAEFEDKYRRLLAEFDNFERAMKNIPDEIKDNAFVEGIDKIYQQVLKTFEDVQVKPIESVGKTFDVKFHNAVMTDETSDADIDTITEELQKGWTYKEQVLRPAMVKVKK